MKGIVNHGGIFTLQTPFNRNLFGDGRGAETGSCFMRKEIPVLPSRPVLGEVGIRVGKFGGVLGQGRWQPGS